jgi:trimethylamine--corrinoid protein Co-methyltransferase
MIDGVYRVLYNRTTAKELLALLLICYLVTSAPFSNLKRRYPVTSKSAPLSFLSSEDIEAIHNATLRILSEIGVILTHTQAREIFASAGASIDRQRVRIPAEVVAKTLHYCPATLALRGRNGKVNVLGDGKLHWHNLGGARDVFDPGTGQLRAAKTTDVAEAARLLDALPNCTTVTPFYTPQDVPGALMSLAMYRHTVPHTLKPIHGPGIQTAAEVLYLVRMAEVIGPPSEMLTLGISPISPLTFPDTITAAIIETAQHGIPFGPLPCPTAGATAPLSLAGALAQQNAELLACIVLAQLVHPGLPIYYCGRLAMLEPRSGGSTWGGVELGMVSATTVQIGHRYGLPVNVYGLSTNAHHLGLQNGYERTLNAAIPALAGADELSGIGEMSAGVMGSLAQMVIDDEIAASVRRLGRGFGVDADSLAVEVIGSVMDGDHNFISEPHTVKYLRAGELLVTKLAERRSRDEWEKSGQVGMVQRAQAKAIKILNEHQVEPLSEAQEAELDRILQSAATELA